MIVFKGATDQTFYFMMVDSAAGTPETGLTITNIDLQYTRNRTAPATKVDATALAATDSAHSDNKAIEVDATSSPGLYRVDWPDAAFATGADKVILSVTCTGCAPAHLMVELVNVNSQVAYVPNAAADAAGGLIISDAGGLDADAQRSDVAAILVDTGTTLDGRIPAALVGGRMDANVGAISSDATAADNAEAFFDGTGYAGTNNVIPSVTTVTGNVTGSVGSLAAQAKADVNAEVVDALATDTYAEPGQGAPAATTTLAAKINYLYKAWRNKKTQTSSTWSLYADDTTTVDQKSAVSDDGTTATRGEVATGP